MALQWILFFGTAIVTYIGISLFAQFSGGNSSSALQAFFSAIRPLPLAILIIANMFFALAIYYGFSITRYAVPIALAIGAMTSFLYSVVVLGTSVSALKVIGIIAIVTGIVLLGL